MAFRAPTNLGMPCRFDRQVEAFKSVRAVEGCRARI